MNCKQAKTQIALWVGDDLDESLVEALQRHLVGCPACHDRWVAMKHSIGVLRRVEAPACSEHATTTVWPVVAARIARRNQPNRLQRFNGWIPALAISAACLAIAVIISDISREPVRWESMPVAESPMNAPLQAKPDGGPLFMFDTHGRVYRSVEVTPHPAEAERPSPPMPNVRIWQVRE